MRLKIKQNNLPKLKLKDKKDNKNKIELKILHAGEDVE